MKQASLTDDTIQQRHKPNLPRAHSNVSRYELLQPRVAPGRTGEAPSEWMIHPNSVFRRTWDILVGCLVLYCATMIPPYVAFGVEEGFAFKVRIARRIRIDTTFRQGLRLDCTATLRASNLGCWKCEATGDCDSSDIYISHRSPAYVSIDPVCKHGLQHLLGQNPLSSDTPRCADSDTIGLQK